jgi:hypothetical protein
MVNEPFRETAYGDLRRPPRCGSMTLS